MTPAKTPQVAEWYSYNAIRSRNALWNIVAGPRSIGKTYGKKIERIKDGIRDDSQTMWVRRNKTELVPAKAGFFDAMSNEYPGFDFRVQGPEGQVRMDGDNWHTLVHFTSLSTAYQLRGTEFPKVDEIDFDECFVEPKENGEPGRYLPDEVQKLRSLWITINRARVDRNGRAKTKVYLLGNLTALDNPWFLEFGFDASKEWQRSGDVVLHLVDAAKYEKRVIESIYGTAIGTVALDYAEGEYILPDGGLVVDERPADSKPLATLVTMRGEFGLWTSADGMRMYVTPGRLAATERPVVAFERLAVRPGIVYADLSDWTRREARRHYNRGSMFLVTAAAMPARAALAR